MYPLLFRHGVCYVFNFAPFDLPVGEVMTSYSAGPDFGLSLTICLETYAYMRHGLSPTEGLIVSLVEPYSMPEVLPAHYIISK